MAQKNKGGRPKTKPYNSDLGYEICHVIMLSEDGLETICKKNPHFPCPTVIYDWALKNEEFAKLYARAKRIQAEILASKVYEVAKDTSLDWARARLQVDTIKWIACKLAPRIYGAQLAIETKEVDAELKQKSLDLRQELEKKFEEEF